jgi:hypothetical protein
VGGIAVSAEIVRLISRPKHKQQTDFPAIAFRSAAAPDDLVMDHVDTGACEFVRTSDRIGPED